jgi:tRNA-Thr(GGU) m(6)t(6)A37 methyltransferase TsaA
VTNPPTAELRVIGRVTSPVSEPGAAVKQGDEGAPEVTVELDAAVADGLRGITAGADLLLLTWLHRADRHTLVVHPRGDPARPETGVFATRSPDRPNPIGLHRVRVLAVDGTRLRISGCEAVDGTPVLDLKPVLGDER